MKRFKHIVSPLSLTEGDAQIIGWASKITRLAETERVVFVHPMDIGEIPDEAKKKYPWLLNPIGDKAIEQMRSRVAELWNGHPDVEIEYRALDRSSQALAANASR